MLKRLRKQQKICWLTRNNNFKKSPHPLSDEGFFIFINSKSEIRIALFAENNLLLFPNFIIKAIEKTNH